MRSADMFWYDESVHFEVSVVDGIDVVLHGASHNGKRMKVTSLRFRFTPEGGLWALDQGEVRGLLYRADGTLGERIGRIHISGRGEVPDWLKVYIEHYRPGHGSYADPGPLAV